ncbi:MAG: RelA/SpoT family protein [Bacteroidales bacterium]|nr:RelA/SpoT family protein [Bacteroidales bacterium]
MLQDESNNIQTYDTEQEKKDILKNYRRLIRVWKVKHTDNKEDRVLIRKAFNVALDAHSGMRRKSGEPYIMHPIEVAIICAEEIGLGTTSVCCALLHDVVEDRPDEYPIEDIRRMFGDKIAAICDGLTKIKDFFDQTEPSTQAVQMKHLLLTLGDDVRVILIKLADRLHNMRTLQYMKPEKRLKIAAETTFLFAPLAHRLGLYAVKSELEDLALKFTEPDIYIEISRRLIESEQIRADFAADFLYPIKRDIAERGYNARIMVRTKSVHSIWQKMKKKQIPFDEVYDVFAIRIIVDVPVKQERSACWEVYAIVTDHYRPKPDRLRDWISIPKANGYQALHTTVMSSIGKWVEVQVRSERMDEIAEKGYAAHFKYKETEVDDRHIENWLDRIRDLLHRNDGDALNFLNDIQGYLFTQEIFIFTRSGELRLLPLGSTVLDFAYGIHSDIGNTCIGANVNHKLKPRYYELKSGDQIEVLTSDKQEPNKEWLDTVKTTRAKTRIKEALKEIRRLQADTGREILQRILSEIGIEFSTENLGLLVKKFHISGNQELMVEIGNGKISPIDVQNFFSPEPRSWLRRINPFNRPKSPDYVSLTDEIIRQTRGKADHLMLKRDLDNLKHTIATCCNPIPGDDVMGFNDKKKGIVIHRSQCPDAIELMSTFGQNIVKAKWTENAELAFLAGIKINGFDRKGMLFELSEIISSHLGLNIKSIHFETEGGIMDGVIMLFVNHTQQLKNLIDALNKVEGIQKVFRIDNYSELDV